MSTAAPPLTDAKADPALGAFAALSLGRYRLLERLSADAATEVWLALSPSLDAPALVALRRMRPASAATPGLRRKFLREARLSSLMKHDGLVRVFELGEQDGLPFVATERLEGASLSDATRTLRRERRGFPPALVARIGRDVARALEHLHAAEDEKGEALSVVHGDVRHANVMLLRDGRVKLLDLGCASSRRDEAGAALLPEASARARCRFLSPEAQRGEPFDGRADVFSLGVLLWELLTQRTLFGGETEEQTRARLLTQPIPNPSRFVSVPPTLERVVLRALARDPARRYRDAGLMADDLELAMRDLPSDRAMLGALVDWVSRKSRRASHAEGLGRAQPSSVGASPAALSEDVTEELPLPVDGRPRPAQPAEHDPGAVKKEQERELDHGDARATGAPSSERTRAATSRPAAAHRAAGALAGGAGLVLLLITFFAWSRPGATTFAPVSAPPTRTAAVPASAPPPRPSAPVETARSNQVARRADVPRTRAKRPGLKTSPPRWTATYRAVARPGARDGSRGIHLVRGASAWRGGRVAIPRLASR